MYKNQSEPEASSDTPDSANNSIQNQSLNTESITNKDTIKTVNQGLETGAIQSTNTIIQQIGVDKYMQIKTYVQTQRAKGISDQEIIAKMRSEKYPEELISALFK